MNYEDIEELVRKSKDCDKLSKEKLSQEFRPLIINISKRTFLDGNDALCFCDDFEENLVDENNLEDFLCDRCDIEELRLAINNLNEDEKELIDFVFFKNNTVKTYAYFKNMCYSTANLKKKFTLNKIYNYINNHKSIKCS